jgi:hypothetical protein
MNLPEKPPLHSDLQAPPTRQTESSTKWKFDRGILRFGLPIVIAGAILCAPSVSPVLAKGGHQADAKEPPAIDPDAMDALNKMGAYLRTLKSFQVKADISTDDVLDDGEIIQSSTKVDLLTARPNRMRAEITGEDEHRFLLFNGKEFTVFGALVNYYATVPAPSTLGKLIDDLNDKYGIEVPLVDLFEWGTKDENIKRIKGATDVGPSAVEGVTCEQYAFRQEGIDWQIWIQLGEFPLPRKLVIRTLTDDAKPQHSEILSWNLAPSFNDEAFTFDPPPDARRITLAEIKAAANEKNK